MSGLFQSLSINTLALSAHSRQLETAGTNLANVNNPDYARQRVNLGSLGTFDTNIGARSMGLAAKSVQQVRDLVLEAQLLRESTERASLEAQATANTWIESNLGEQVERQGTADDASSQTPVATGISKAVDDFFVAIEALSADPNNSAERNAVIQRAEIMAERFHAVDERMTDIESSINEQIEGDVAKANAALEEIAELNLQIRRFELNRPGTAVDLRDQRQAQLAQLAEYINFETTDQGNGSLQVITYDTASNPVVLVDGSETQGELTFDGTNVFGGLPPVQLDLTGGSIHGYREAREGSLVSTRSRLDALASEIVSRINTAYNTEPPTANFFDPAGLTAATIAIDSSLSISGLKTGVAGEPSSNTIALAMTTAGRTEYTSGQFSGENFSDFMARLVSDVGSNLQLVVQSLANQEAVEGLLRDQRDSASAVSIDEETADLIRFQRSFEATARVINILDEMLNTVVNGLVR